jgi:hypothetical protein
MLRLRIRLAKAMNRFPHEVDEMTPDDFWLMVAEHKLSADELEEARNK